MTIIEVNPVSFRVNPVSFQANPVSYQANPFSLQEEEMRRMMAQQAEMAAARGETVEETETSQSDWSEDHDHDDVDVDATNGVSRDNLPPNVDKNLRDSYNLDALSNAAADVHSLFDADDRGHDGDMDDTSVSSRGSPRLLNPNNGGEM